ncbi:hypothetical protein [Fundidesulfovibrio agrisoli]|uniref:hypothetical protein n=1 Tax=Fundidesulfovibrio agrisoli TaxID=2922717 RepID=UPI001FAC7CAB|nr:hypothetical protein [Fundidesulfovibrio agrisoli]
MAQKSELKKVVKEILQLFAETQLLGNRNSQVILFGKLIAELLDKHFASVTVNDHSTTEEPNKLIKFMVETNHENETNMYQISVSSTAYSEFSKLISGLQRHISTGQAPPFHVIRTKTATERTLLYENGSKTTQPIGTHSCTSHNISWSTPNTIAHDEEFYETLITAGITCDDEDTSDIRDFFSGGFNSVADMARSALVNYYIYYGGFRNISHCEACCNIYLASRKGKNKGLYCSTKCQRKFYNNTNKHFISCQNKHRNMIDYLEDHIKGYPQDELNNTERKEHDELIKTIKRFKPKPPSSEECRSCEANNTARQNNTRVKAGQCPCLLRNNCFSAMVRFKSSYKNYRKRTY